MELDLIVRYISENFSISFRRQTIIIIDGDEYSKREILDAVGITPFTATKTLEWYNATYPKDKDKQSFSVRIFDALRKHTNNQVRSTLQIGELPESRPTFDTYIPVVDVERNAKVLINRETKELSIYSYDVWFASLDEAQKKIIPEYIRPARFLYDPYDISTLVMMPFENYELLKVNLYVPPKWRLEINLKRECPQIVTRFLEHLFPTEDAREYVLDWLYHALTTRHEAYLVLNGAKGIGKGVFCALAKLLVGKDNYTEAPDSFLDTHFNSALDKRRVIVLDEVRVDKEAHTKLKRYINKFQNIEKKGLDADKAVETFNSFIISNNDETDMYLEHDDRRFACPDMTTVPLKYKFSTEEITELMEKIESEDLELARDFGYFIYNRGAKKYDPFSIYMGEKYHRLIQVSLKVWQKFILEKIVEGTEEVLEFPRLKSQARARDNRMLFPSEPQKLVDFITNYRYKGDIKLGEIEYIDGVAGVRVNPSLFPEQDDSAYL
jgi:hypothetical protein